MSSDEIVTFEGGRYNDDVRACVDRQLFLALQENPCISSCGVYLTKSFLNKFV